METRYEKGWCLICGEAGDLDRDPSRAGFVLRCHGCGVQEKWSETRPLPKSKVGDLVRVREGGGFGRGWIPGQTVGVITGIDNGDPVIAYHSGPKDGIAQSSWVTWGVIQALTPEEVESVTESLPPNLVILPPAKKAPPVNPLLVNLARKILEMAESGEITSLAVATIHRDGSCGTAFEGDNFIELMGAVSLVRAKIERRFE